PHPRHAAARGGARRAAAAGAAQAADAVTGAAAPPARVRRPCRSLPEVIEAPTHGAPPWFVRGRRPVVTFVDPDEHPRLDLPHVAIWAAAPPRPTASSSRASAGTTGWGCGSTASPTGPRSARWSSTPTGRRRRRRSSRGWTPTAPGDRTPTEGYRGVTYAPEMPPSTRNVEAVMKLASSLARNATAEAISSARAKRPIGTCTSL